MKNKIILLFGLAVIGSLLIYAFTAAGPEAKPSARAPEVSAPSSKAPEPLHSAEAPRASISTPTLAVPPTLESTARQTIMETIQTASISYDPIELPRIQPFLSHPDPEVRAAALNGIVMLGHAAGAPLLREAAKRAATPQEAVELLSKADYLELPSAPIGRGIKKAGARTTPTLK
ncbi:MAG: hypothetical protein ABL974_01305 [Prosthecobacter sp.]